MGGIGEFPLSVGGSGNARPVAQILSSYRRAVIGSAIRLDGRASYDAEGDELTYTWSFVQVPIGSAVNQASLVPMEDDNSAVMFSPDVAGVYEVKLIVADSEHPSLPVSAIVDVFMSLVPYHEGTAPDVSYIWRFMPDFWNKVEDKKKIELIWQASFQAIAADLLSLYQYDYNKSISTIQELRQRKWLSFRPYLTLSASECTFTLTEDIAGVGGSSQNIDPDLLTVRQAQEGYVSHFRVPYSEGRFDISPIGRPFEAGKLLCLGDTSYPISGFTSSRSVILQGSDGSVIAGTSILNGSGFTDGMVGCRAVVRLSSGIRAATITAKLTSTSIQLDAPNWTSSEFGLNYSVQSSSDNVSVAIVRDSEIPAGSSDVTWRVASTLVSKEYDFVAMGVSAGDFLEADILRTDIGVSGVIRCAIVGVWSNKLSFVLSDTPTAGTPSRKIANRWQLGLSVELGVPGLFEDINDELVYGSTAAEILNTVNQLKWKRAYYERPLTSDTDVDVGPFKIRIRPRGIYRTKKLAVDPALVALPVLQEYVNPVTIGSIGNDPAVVTPSGDLVSVDHAPIKLRENHQYILDDQSKIFGRCTLTAQNPVIYIPNGDLLRKSVGYGDRIITDLAGTEFSVIGSITDDSVRVSPTPTISGTTGYRLLRKTPGKFIRFVPDTFSAVSPPPKNLWAEVSYFDNSDIVEANFGKAVGLLREDLKNRGASIPYLSAVAGLLYFLTSGRSLNDGRLAAQVLFGLPFSRSEGIIRRIDSVYIRRPDNSPEYARMVIAETDQGSLTGRNYVYLIPLGPQVPHLETGEWVPAFAGTAGIATNPDTGKVFEVGDRVYRYDVLSNGVTYGDYISEETALPPGLTVDKYHTFVLGVNLDLVRNVDVDMAAEYLTKNRASHTMLQPVGVMAREDGMVIEDAERFVIHMPVFDNTSLGLPTALKLDLEDFNNSYLRVTGEVLRRILWGSDLNLPAVGAGGVATVSQKLLDSSVLPSNVLYDGHRLRPGDELNVIGGPNAGHVRVIAVDSDMGFEFTPDVFSAQTGASYSIERSVQNPIEAGTCTASNSSSVVTMEDRGAVTAGAAVGDTLVLAIPDGNGNWVPSKEYAIAGTSKIGDMHTILYLDKPINEVIDPDSYLPNFAVVRKGLLCKSFMGPLSSPPTLYATGAVGSETVKITGGGAFDILELACIPNGSTLHISGISYTVNHQIRGTGLVKITPPLQSTITDAAVSFDRLGSEDAPISFDEMDQIPHSEVALSLVADTGKLVYSSGSDSVTTDISENFSDLGVRPGDFIKITSGDGAAKDLGYGPGMFPIYSLSIATAPRLCEIMDHSSPVGGATFSIVRTMNA